MRTFASVRKENKSINRHKVNTFTHNQVKKLPAGRVTFSAGAGGGGGAGFGAGTDGFFSTGGDTLGIQDFKIITKKKWFWSNRAREVQNMKA